MSTFFSAILNLWVQAGENYPPAAPSPNPPSTYPVFDPLTNQWITSGEYGVNPPKAYPFFSLATNTWITSGAVEPFVAPSDGLSLSDIQSIGYGDSITETLFIYFDSVSLALRGGTGQEVVKLIEKLNMNDAVAMTFQ